MVIGPTFIERQLNYQESIFGSHHLMGAYILSFMCLASRVCFLFLCNKWQRFLLTLYLHY